MFVFATAEPYGAYHLVPLAAVFNKKATHLIPDIQTPVQGQQFLKTTDDQSVLSTCTALIITGGGLNEWTESLAVKAASLDKPVFYVELAYAVETPTESDTSWLTHAFAGSDYSRHILSTHFKLPAHKVTTVGYPHLDILSSPEIRKQLENPAALKNVLLLGSVETPELHELLERVGEILTDLGFNVTVRKHPRDTTTWEGNMPVSKELLATDLINNATVIGIPGTAFIAAAAAGRQLLYPTYKDYEEFIPETHTARLGQAINLDDWSTAEETIAKTILEYEPINPDIQAHYLGPVDGQASVRFKQSLYTHEVTYFINNVTYLGQ